MCNQENRRMLSLQNPSRGKPFAPILLNVSKNVLLRESIFKGDGSLGKIINDEQVRSSFIYEQLGKKIAHIKHRAKVEAREFLQKQKAIEENLKTSKEGIHAAKVDIWEVKNQLTYLQEQLEKQQREYQESLRQEEEGYQEEGQNDEQEDEGEDEDEGSQQGGTEHCLGQGVPSCSIRDFIEQSRSQICSDWGSIQSAQIVYSAKGDYFDQ